MILVFSTSGDIHARHVMGLLQERGHEVEIIDTSKLGDGGSRLAYDIGSSPVFIDSRGRRQSWANVKTVWMRRPRPASLPDTMRTPEVRRFCQREWADTLDGLFLELPARFINPPVAELGAVKLRQLRVGMRCGLRVPPTLVTSDPAAAEEFIAKWNGDVIHKAQTSPANRLFETRLWQEEDRPALGSLPLAPVVFQRRVSGPADIRVPLSVVGYFVRA